MHRHRTPERLTEDQARRMLATMNDVIRAGEEMRKLRAEMIKVFAGYGWTQEKIARLTDMSQPAVSKQVTKYRTERGTDDPEPPMRLALAQYDTPWLEGRLWGLAEEIAESCYETARCTRFVNAAARGRKRFTPRTVDELRRLVEEDLTHHQAQLPAAYRAAYDEISRGLDDPPKVTGPAPAEGSPQGSGSASVRRALAHRLQCDRLRGEA